MEITVIHGQGHKGSTYHITKAIEEKLAGEDTVVHEYFMPKDGPAHCLGCCQCILHSEELCPQREILAGIEQAILRSQVIIIDSPLYCMEMSGQLKTLFDHFGYLWLTHRPKREMYHKIGIAVSTAAGAGQAGVTKSIARQLFWWGVPVVYRVHFAANASRWEDVSAQIRAKIERKTRVVSSKVLKRAGKANRNFLGRFLFGMMRKMQSSNSWNETDRNYWQQQGWLKAARPWKNG